MNASRIRIDTASFARIVTISIIILLNVIGTRIEYITLIVAAFEWIYLLFLLLQRKYEKAYGWLLVFISSSFEVMSFIYLRGRGGVDIFSVWNLPIIRSYLYRACVIFLTYSVLRKYKTEFGEQEKKYPYIKHFIHFLWFLLISGALIGCFCYLLNDNNVANLSWYLEQLIVQSLNSLCLTCLIICGLVISLCNTEHREFLKELFVNYLVASIFVATYTVVANYRGYYNYDHSIMLMPLASSLCATIILFPAFNEKRYKIHEYFVLWVIFIVDSLIAKSAMGSKYYIVIILTFIVFIIVMYRKLQIRSVIIATLVFIASIIVLPTIINIINSSEQSFGKFSQLIQVFDLKNINGVASWYLNLNDSPKERVEEFVNIFLEFMEKPWFLFLGKGIPGSIFHTWGTTNWNAISAFNEAEVSSGVYSTMHESLNVLFLRHGIMGLVFFVTYFVRIFKRLRKTPYAAAALIWFGFYWNVYTSWLIGVLALVLTLSDNADN